MKTILTYLFFSFMIIASAQVKNDSVYTFPEVAIESKAVLVSLTLPLTDYKYLVSKNLNDVLRESAGLYMRNYGNGQLSSITIRGTSAAQTDLLWNGIKLNSPALGQVDVALFNMSMSDQLELGGVSRSGNVGGFINLKNEMEVDSTFSFNAAVTYGSFNTLRTSGKAVYGNGKFSGATRISYLFSNNDYTFINTYKQGKPKEKLPNAKVKTLNIMQQFNAKVNEGNSIHFSLWLSDAQRQIAPIISNLNNKEAQDDYSLRSSLVWKGQIKKVKTQFASAFLHDVIHFRNPQILLNETSTMQAFRNNFSITYDSLRRFSFYGEAGYDLERAIVPSYQSTRQRHIGKLTAGAKFFPNENILLQLDLRESVYAKNFSPFSPALTFRYYKSVAPRHYFILRATGSRNFRFPTLNDLYWLPGGNPNLKTEKSWDGEASAQYFYRSYFSFKATGFCKYIDNWIQWIPSGAYWSPQNVKKVLTRGVEISARTEFPKYSSSNKFRFSADAHYTYTRTTNLTSILSGDQSKDKQLIYVPLHVANATLTFEYKYFFLRIMNTYSDAVFTTSDNSPSEKLKGYYLLDLETGKDFNVRDCEIGISFRVNNITGVSYQTMLQRPMPGRSFEGTLRFKIIK